MSGINKQDSASGTWKTIKPFAASMIAEMLTKAKSKQAPSDPYVILLYDASEQVIRSYSMSDAGFTAALATAASGDIILVPPGTLTAGGGSYSAGDELATGAITVTSNAGNVISGLTVGIQYAIEAFNGYWNRGGGGSSGLTESNFSFSLTPTTGFTGNVGRSIWGGVTYENTTPPDFATSAEMFTGADTKRYGRIYFTAPATSIYVRVADEQEYFADNQGSLSWRLLAAQTIASNVIPSGVEVVGLGKNAIFDGAIENNGILTNIQVTGAITGAGQIRLVPNPTVELFSNQIKSLIATGTAPFVIASTTAVTNLNADLVDGEHAQKSNLSATTAPTVTDDSGAGYSVGSVWINVTADKAYICVDATVGAAVWNEAGGAGHDAVTVSDTGTVDLSLTGQALSAAVIPGGIDAADLASGAATDNYVLTADGSGGAAWEAPTAGSGDIATDTIWDAAGDIVQGTGANTAARLAIGTAGQVLKVNAGATAVEWGAGGGSATGYLGTQLLRTVVAAGGQANFDLSSIDAGYDVIKIFLRGKSEYASGVEQFLMTFNNDTTNANYRTARSWTGSYGGGEVVDTRIAGWLGGSTNDIAQNEITIINYAGGFWKTSQNHVVLRLGNDIYTQNYACTWESTAAINRITLTTTSGSDFAEGTLCVIVGYKNFT